MITQKTINDVFEEIDSNSPVAVIDHNERCACPKESMCSCVKSLFEQEAELIIKLGLNTNIIFLTEYLAGRYWYFNSECGDEMSYHKRRMEDSKKQITHSVNAAELDFFGPLIHDLSDLFNLWKHRCKIDALYVDEYGIARDHKWESFKGRIVKGYKSKKGLAVHFDGLTSVLKEEWIQRIGTSGFVALDVETQSVFPLIGSAGLHAAKNSHQHIASYITLNEENIPSYNVVLYKMK